ncbi:uncharacterized protein LOC121729984 [Aricia agestis]|uniref:uncharacterized protein LOC121729984 n=1 Tax=Aricia agestis TaxID=91739 RepID=UPI001C20BB4F|nr:uncharacterized protein LOC121729984 [Aricia agestis]
MDKKQITGVILAVLVLGADANAISGKNANARWDFGLSANVNEYVDNTIDLIIPFLQNNGLDPMELPEIIEGFEVRPLLITYSAWVQLHDGYMTGLVNVARSGDQKVNYFAKMLRVRVELEFTNLEFMYKYLIKVMNIGPTGGVIGSLDRFFIVADVLIDFNNDEVHLQQFALQNIGRLRVRLTGNILTDWLLNPFITLFVTIFDTIIMRVVEVNIRNAAQSAILTINSGIRDVINVIESYN